MTEEGNDTEEIVEPDDAPEGYEMVALSDDADVSDDDGSVKIRKSDNSEDSGVSDNSE